MAYQQNKYTIWGLVRGASSSKYVHVKVLGFLDHGKWEYDSAVIKDVFYPSGHVYGPFFNQGINFKNGDLIRAFAIPNPKHDIREDDDEWILSYQETIKTHGWKIHEVAQPLESENQLALPKNLFLEASSPNPFFLLSDGKVYGKFNEKDGKVSPHGSEIDVWLAEEFSICSFDGVVCFRDTPKSAPRKIDSSTDEELLKWFSKELKRQTAPGQIEIAKHPQLKAAILDMLQFSDSALFEVRVKRMQSAIIDFDYRFDELSRFLENSQAFRNAYGEFLAQQSALVQEKIEKEMRANHLELESLQEEKSRLQGDLEALQEIVQSLKSELEFLQANRERLITEMRVLIATGLVPTAASTNEARAKDQYFERHTFPNDTLAAYESAENFAESFQADLSKRGLFVKQTFVGGMVSILRQHRAILIPDTRLVTGLAKASNNATVIIQQVEPDWIKFESCWRSGLSQILEEAIAHPSRLHFLVLEDINLASPECWGRPLFAVHSGQRETFPILGIGWPKNFWLFGTKIRTQEPHSIGLPIYRHTFKAWGGIKEINLTEPRPLKEGHASGYVGLNDLLNDWDLDEMKMPNGNQIEAYFDVTDEE